MSCDSFRSLASAHAHITKQNMTFKRNAASLGMNGIACFQKTFSRPFPWSWNESFIFSAPVSVKQFHFDRNLIERTDLKLPTSKS
jgi:hypothetical protein